MGFHDIEVEGNALGIIKLLQSQEEDISIINNLIEEVKSKAMNFQSCIFMHAGREGNKVADNLVKHGLEVREKIFWLLMMYFAVVE